MGDPVETDAWQVLGERSIYESKWVTLGKAEYSPYLEHGYPDRVYFGDTHLHTSYSTDAGMFGCKLGQPFRASPSEPILDVNVLSLNIP